MKVLSEITREQFENSLNKLINYVIEFDKEYQAKVSNTEFEAGQRFAYATILDTVKNQLAIDGVKLDGDLEDMCTRLLLNEYSGDNGR